MNKTMITLIILIVIGVAIGSSGQIFLKKGLKELSPINTKLNSLPTTIFKVITNKFVFFGLCLSAIAALFWIFALSGINLSVAYPLAGGLFYISVIAMSVIFLKEKVSLMQIIGTCVTLLGVIILAKSAN